MSGICADRVVVITGAGRGIGRAHALEFARQGAKVVVNDLGGGRDGEGNSFSPAQDVVEEINEAGGHAFASTEDVSDWDGAGRLIQTTIDTFGGLDVLVNNAGILRDRMLVNMSVEEWDAVMKVHLRGTFCPTRHAIDYWRAQSKAGTPRDARIINTSSPTGLYGNAGQANYGTAKAGLAGLTVIEAEEFGRYGVTVNAIAPSAMTRMTEDLDAYVTNLKEIEERTGWNAGAPENIAPLVVWLGSAESAGVTGRVFNVRGGHISVAETWQAGPGVNREGLFATEEIGEIIPNLVEKARPNSDGAGRPRTQ